MPAFNRAIAAGNRYAFAWFIDDNGFMTGASTTAPANGAAGSGAFTLSGIKTAAPTIPEPDVVQVTGDDALQGEFSFDSIETRAFTIEYTVEDLSLIATILGVTLTTWGEVRTALMDVPNPPERNMGFIFQSRAKKADTGAQGQKGWNGKFIPLATFTPLGRASFDERGAAVFRGQISPQSSGYDPFGVSILTSNYGTTAARQIPFNAENPIHIKTWRGDNTTTAFTLDYVPVSAAKTSAFVDRVVRTVSTVSTGASTMTVSSAPGTGRPMIALYEFAG